MCWLSCFLRLRLSRHRLYFDFVPLYLLIFWFLYPLFVVIDKDVLHIMAQNGESSFHMDVHCSMAFFLILYAQYFRYFSFFIGEFIRASKRDLSFSVLCHRWASYSVCFLADTFDFCFLCFDFVWSSLRFLCVHVVVCLVAKILFYQIENQWKHIVFCVGYCLFLFDSVWFYCFFSIWHFRGWWCIWQHHIRNNLAETCVELATKILSIIQWMLLYISGQLK